MSPRLQRDKQRLTDHDQYMNMERPLRLSGQPSSPHDQQAQLQALTHLSGPGLDRSLYYISRYQYPHTLSFINKFSPDDEAHIIWEFNYIRSLSVQANNVHLPSAPSSLSHRTSQGQAHTKGASDTRWGIYVADL